MKIKLGDIVESDFGKGKVLAFTKWWVIHNDSENGYPDIEYAVSLEDHLVWSLIEIEGSDSVITEIEVPDPEK